MTPPAFAKLGLGKSVLQALTELGYSEPTPIQAATIPLLLAGRDVLGQAQTEFGKTAAFAAAIAAAAGFVSASSAGAGARADS
ncbi:MAG UNVERIFIED_CONTAM: DEAD/DEAH box helicase [Planctomycetaceae bacterium]